MAARKQAQVSRIGFIGLGIMGAGMVQNLIAKGQSVRVWNRSPERIRELGLEDRSTASPAALAAASDIVIACVADPVAVERVVFAEDGVLGGAHAGLTYVECSTISPSLVHRMQQKLAEREVRLLEAPVTGSRLGARNGTLLFMTGGAPELHAELEPTLLMMGSRAIYCGPTGKAALMKLICNTLISFMLEGLAEGLLVAEKGELPVEKVLEVIAASGFASPYYAFKGAAIRDRAFDTHFSIDLLVKDQSLMLEEAARHGAPMPGLAAIREVFQAARAQGHGSADIAAVFRALERAAGLD
jgi:3-hydroxyisobutyrate dehydrogenase-like beta-hydroxyacid dehydrogenase